MLPEFLPGAVWLEIFDLYGYDPDAGADPEDAYLWCVGKNPGPLPGFHFAASEFAAVEVAFVIEFVGERLLFDEDEFKYCIQTVCDRRRLDS